MKRGKALKRNRPLRGDPAKVREFLQRGRGGLERAELKARPKRRPKEGPLSPREWHDALFIAANGRCAVSGETAKHASDPRFHGHHALPRRDLRAHGWYGHVWDPRNGIWLRADVHLAHEFAPWTDGIAPHTLLPRSVWEFCNELDVLEGTHWATDLVLRLHPIRRVSGVVD